MRHLTVKNINDSKIMKLSDTHFAISKIVSLDEAEQSVTLLKKCQTNRCRFY